MSTQRRTSQDSAVEGLENLSPELKKELQDLEEQFEVDKAKLKEIVVRFGEELVEGLQKDGANLVRLISIIEALRIY
jgi:hexokinase